jgi:hypothetical protein
LEPKANKGPVLIIISLLVILAAIVLVFLILVGGDEQTQPVDEGSQPAVEDRGQFQEGMSPFYDAGEGRWILLDTVTHVLREQKYVSSDREREEYTLFKVPAGGEVRIIEAQGRWKKVEVRKGSEVLGTGWIDADGVKEVRKVPEREIPQ